MDDKSFEFLTKMYSELSEFRKDITDKVEHVGNQVMKLENGLKEDVKALFDGYKQTYEKLDIIEFKMDAISNATQDIELKVLKGGR